MSADPAPLAPSRRGGAAVERKCAECEADDEPRGAGKRAEPDGDLLGKRDWPPRTMTSAADAHIRSLPGRGRPLPAAERAFFESRLAHPLDRVRIHTGVDAAQATRSVGARALTYGNDVAFAPGEYQPTTDGGRRLLAHELAHVIQQLSGPTVPVVQRELATPPPAVAPAPQPDLTPQQITAALNFNRARYDATRTREIQDLVGTTPTGVWIDQDVLAIAQLQEEYGLTKDGKVGPATFRFLDAEVRREGIPHTDANCLLAFEVRNFGVTDAGHVAGHRDITGHFEVSAQFSRTCGCADYQYRQFIRGHAIRRPAGGGAPVDLGPTFTIPGGGLPAAFSEDGDTTPGAVPNYGHRDQAAEDGNQYLNDVGGADQAAGCRYESRDLPGGPFPFAPGDELDLDINFRGEIRRRGRVVQTKFWTAIRRIFR